METLEAAAQRIVGEKARGYEFENVYPYYRADGSLHHAVVRARTPKGDKKWIRPIHAKGTRWVVGKPKGEKSPIYQIAEVIDSTGAVYVVEGEKKVEALRRFGLVATTSGSSSSWGSVDWECLSGREIVFWRDLDEPGLKYEVHVVQQLLKLKCRVKRIDVDKLGLEASGDCVDWLATRGGATREEIEKLPLHDPAEPVDQEIEESKAGKVSPALDYARVVLDEIGAENILYTKGDFWMWSQNGIWRRVQQEEVHRQILKVIPEDEANFSIIWGICAMLRLLVFSADHEFDVSTETINCMNGELTFSDEVWTLVPHARSHFHTKQIPIEYDSRAKAERFECFLFEIFEGDSDQLEKVTMVLEMIGYSLVSSTQFEKFIVLIGSGANGKSVLLGVLEALLGRKNVAGVAPAQFENQFQRAHLHGKLANIVTEIAEGAVIPDAQLKAITSGEITTAEHKFKDPFEFRPFCTCWFGTNHMPHTRDFSRALMRRAIILLFNNRFDGANCDVKLKDKLLVELPGILNLALDAYAKVLGRGSFTDCESNHQAKKEWALECDQVAQFIEDRCELGSGSEYEVQTSDLYRVYEAWAREMGVKATLGHNAFSKRLKGKGIVSVPRTQGVRMLCGIRERWSTGDASDTTFKMEILESRGGKVPKRGLVNLVDG